MKKFRDQKHKEKIIDRIRKLLAVSTGTSFEAEAATALRMAKGWMTSYGLSIEEIESQPAEENVDRKTTLRTGRLAPWEKILALAIEVLCDTKLILYQLGDRRTTFIFIGLKDDTEMSVKLYDTFNTGMKLMAAKEYPDSFRRRSFLLGMADCLVKRARIETAEAKAVTPTYGALVVVKENQIQEYMNEYFKSNTRKSAIRTSYSAEAYERGFEEGKKVDLGTRKKLDD